MNNINIENKLNEYTQGRFGFKFKSAELDKRTLVCVVEFLYKDGVILPADTRKDAEDFVKNNLPKNFEYEVKFIKNFLVNESVSNSVKDFMKKNFPSVLYSLNNVDCEEDKRCVSIDVGERVFEYVSNRKIKQLMETYLFENYSANISVEFGINKEAVQEPEEIECDEVEIFSTKPEKRFIEVSDVEPLIGELTETLAYYIKDKTVPEEDVVVCGNVLFIKEYSYTPKKKEKKDDSNNNENKKDELSEINELVDGEVANDSEVVVKNERKYFKFVVQDFTEKLSCVFFANKNNLEQIQKLEPKQPVIIMGRLEEDKFSGGVSMRVKSISKCKLPEVFEEEIVYKSEPKSYKYVFPEKYEQYSQFDLFTTEEKKYDEFIMNNKFVVFDFETTGLELNNGDKIVEIGAVKVENGKITEKFSSYVDPEMKIPADSTKIHGITDEDVKGAPTYDKVLADFYKFTRGCYLSGYNIIGFDCPFLITYGKKSGYNFDNPVVDVYKIAQKEVVGVKNYKLGTIAAKLGVTLDNAHRAVYDTIATAEVLLKLAETCTISETK